jgi:hypothetical protein
MSLFRIKHRNPLKCCECDFCIKGETFYNILGDTYCRKCADEWIRDEILDKFDQHRDKLAEMVGVQVLEGFSFE